MIIVHTCHEKHHRSPGHWRREHEGHWVCSHGRPECGSSFFVSCVTFLVPTCTSKAVSPEASLAQLVEHILHKRMSWVRSRQKAFRCPSAQQALVPVRTSQSRRPAAAVTVPFASRQRVPSGFPLSLAGEPAIQDSVTELLR